MTSSLSLRPMAAVGGSRGSVRTHASGGTDRPAKPKKAPPAVLRGVVEQTGSRNFGFVKSEGEEASLFFFHQNNAATKLPLQASSSTNYSRLCGESFVI